VLRIGRLHLRGCRPVQPLRHGREHKKLETTSMYAQVATEVLREVIRPIETLPPG
jgi:hypothetical protein